MSVAVQPPRPVAALDRLTAYRRSPEPRPIDLYLDANEGPPPPAGLLAGLAADAGSAELLRRYPAAAALTDLLARRHGVGSERVLVTNGSDEGLDRLCRAFLEPGRNAVIPQPTFAMLERYVRLAGGSARTVAWPGPPFPTAEILATVDEATALILLVSPNNPTGATLSAADLEALATGAPRALVVIDHAYVEFADDDLTGAVLALPNAVVTRTLSKAWGLAGLRVGYTLGPAVVIAELEKVGSPYPVSAPSLALAVRRLASDPGVEGYVDRVRHERRQIGEALARHGFAVSPSEANFVFARNRRAGWLAAALAGLGIAVRTFGDDADAVRITCPGDPGSCERLLTAIATALAPEAVLFDLDGVLADVSRSYRAAIVATAAAFGVELSAGDVAAGKAAGDANNDWRLTRRLLAERGVEADLEAVTARFEDLYQGSEAAPGLRRHERLIPDSALLAGLAERYPLGLVTGRPRADARRFLDRFGLGELFATVVTLEDAPAKPDPAPVARALEELGVERAWMIGDTPDDVVAARRAGVVAVAIPAPGDGDGPALRDALDEAGAALVLDRIEELEELLP